jgi:predicted helicase
MQYQLPIVFLGSKNLAICISGGSSSKPYQSLIVKEVPCYDFLEKTQCLPLYRYTEGGARVENITDWGLEQFRAHYGERKIQKKDIFHYVYAVLHNPAYRKKYELDLKREFPRVPFYDDFWQWAAWGKRLMDLHLNYESAKPFGLKPIDLPDEKVPKELKVRLKANKEKGIIEIDEQTTLSGVPKEAWEYKLGNRSALEWILDQYKETKPKDKTIAERFDTYRFADYKERVIDLLQRVCTVSVETVRIMREMKSES